jgi:hypothetical protein
MEGDLKSMQGKSRREILKAFRVPYDEAPQPDADMRYLQGWWVEAGMVAQGGMGPAPLTWREVEAFERGSCTDLTPWERARIISLSRVYSGSLSEYRDQKAPAPYKSEATAQALAERDEQIKKDRERREAAKGKKRK